MSRKDATRNTEPRAEFFTLAGIAAALGTSATLAGQAFELLTPNEPFIVQVLDSRHENGEYVIHLKLHNRDVHTIYVESLVVQTPLRLKAIQKPPSKGIGDPFDTAAPPVSFDLPCRILSGKVQDVVIIVDKPSSGVKSGTVQFEISRLGEASSERRKTSFLVRT
jgi:hypothetical protein